MTSTTLNATVVRMQNSSKSFEVKELVDLFGKLRIGVDASDPLHRVEVSTNNMQRWVYIEVDEEVTGALCGDMVEDIERHELDKDEAEGISSAEEDEDVSPSSYRRYSTFSRCSARRNRRPSIVIFPTPVHTFTVRSTSFARRSAPANDMSRASYS